MVRASRSVPAALAALLLAAHFYRAAAFLPAAVCVAAAVLAFVRRPLAVAALRLGLIAGSILWIVTAWRIAQDRLAAGTAYVRMIVILGGVAAFTALAAFLLPDAPRD